MLYRGLTGLIGGLASMLGEFRTSPNGQQAAERAKRAPPRPLDRQRARQARAPRGAGTADPAKSSGPSRPPIVYR